MKSTIADRIRTARLEAGLNKSELARRVGVSAPTVTDWESGVIKELKSHNLIKLGQVLNVSHEWLASGTPPKERAKIVVELPTAYEINEAQPFYPSGTVPLISWTQAGQWSELVDNLHPGDAERMVPTSKPMGPHAFALRIRGDSMEPTIPDGAIVVVDPDTPAEHRKIVIVKQNDHGEATCKRLVYEGERPYLKPDNPSYPVLEMQPDAQVCGVVRQIIIETD